MVINYRPLNVALIPIRYSLPSKDSLFVKNVNYNIFNKFDIKSEF
jgi:hypothetical protein